MPKQISTKLTEYRTVVLTLAVRVAWIVKQHKNKNDKFAGEQVGGHCLSYLTRCSEEGGKQYTSSSFPLPSEKPPTKSRGLRYIGLRQVLIIYRLTFVKNFLDSQAACL